jgi:hypothetical protein
MPPHASRGSSANREKSIRRFMFSSGENTLDFSVELTPNALLCELLSARRIEDDRGSSGRRLTRRPRLGMRDGFQS